MNENPAPTDAVLEPLDELWHSIHDHTDTPDPDLAEKWVQLNKYIKAGFPNWANVVRVAGDMNALFRASGQNECCVLCDMIANAAMDGAAWVETDVEECA